MVSYTLNYVYLGREIAIVQFRGLQRLAMLGGNSLLLYKPLVSMVVVAISEDSDTSLGTPTLDPLRSGDYR